MSTTVTTVRRETDTVVSVVRTTTITPVRRVTAITNEVTGKVTALHLPSRVSAIEYQKVSVLLTQQRGITVLDRGHVGPQGIQGVQGIQGIQGPSGATIEQVRLSSGALSALRVVRDTGDGSHVGLASPTSAIGVIGVLLTAAGAAEQPVTVIEFGEMTDGSWSWAQGPLWVGVAGVLTQTPPLAGTLLQVAEALSPTRILVLIRAPLIRA